MIQPHAEWRAFLDQGRFMIQRSRSSGRHVFYPRIAEPGSGDEDLEWVEACGHGEIHAITIVARKEPAETYNVALVELAEGPRLMTRIDEIDNGAIRIGMKVKARIGREDDQSLLVFVPA